MNAIAKFGIGFLVATGSLLAMRASVADGPLTDAEFVYRASQAGIVEVAMGRIALENSRSSDVQRFALAMIADHDKANDELKILARKKGLTLVDEAAAADKAREIAESINKETFDVAYVSNQVDAHEQAVSLFSNAATQLIDADLQAYVKEKLPQLKHHLTMARELASKKSPASVQ